MWRGAAAPAAAASERRGESARLGALEAGLRAWKSAAGRGGGALRPAGLLPRVASPPGAARPMPGPRRTPRSPAPRAPLRARRLARRRPDCRNGRPGGTPAAVRVGCGDPRGSRGAASATGDLLAARGGRRGPRDGRWSSFPKVSGGTGDSRVKREQHVHRRQAIKTTLEHARSPASARAHAASIPGMTPLSRSSRVTLQSWEPSPSLLLKFLVHQAFFDILTLLM